MNFYEHQGGSMESKDLSALNLRNVSRRIEDFEVRMEKAISNKLTTREAQLNRLVQEMEIFMSSPVAKETIKNHPADPQLRTRMQHLSKQLQSCGVSSGVKVASKIDEMTSKLPIRSSIPVPKPKPVRPVRVMKVPDAVDIGSTKPKAAPPRPLRSDRKVEP